MSMGAPHTPPHALPQTLLDRRPLKEYILYIFTQWSLKKKSIPKTRMERQDLLETLYSSEHKRRKELAFNVALNDMLLVQGVSSVCVRVRACMRERKSE